MTIAYDSGVNFFDNAEAYANGKAEIVMGKILKRRGWGRDTFLVSSKVFWGGDLPNQEGLSRKHVIEACHAALRRLRVDYLDLYLCHRPDPNTPIEETVRAMSDLIAQGKVLYWGTSEWSAREITRRTRSREISCSSRRRWSSRNTTCFIAIASKRNSRRFTSGSVSASRSGRRSRPAFSPENTTTAIRAARGFH